MWPQRGDKCDGTELNVFDEAQTELNWSDKLFSTQWLDGSNTVYIRSTWIVPSHQSSRSINDTEEEKLNSTEILRILYVSLHILSQGCGMNLIWATNVTDPCQWSVAECDEIIADSWKWIVQGFRTIWEIQVKDFFSTFHGQKLLRVQTFLLHSNECCHQGYAYIITGPNHACYSVVQPKLHQLSWQLLIEITHIHFLYILFFFVLC